MRNKEKEELFKQLVLSDCEEDRIVAYNLYKKDYKEMFRVLRELSIEQDVTINIHLDDEEMRKRWKKYMEGTLSYRISKIDWREHLGMMVFGYMLIMGVLGVVALLYLIISFPGWWIAFIPLVLAVCYLIGRKIGQ